MCDLLRRLGKVHSSVDDISFDFLHQEKQLHCAFPCPEYKAEGKDAGCCRL
jgi:hypothetical protein